MKELKSISLSRPCMLISILVFLMTIIFFMNSVLADVTHKEIIQDLPRKTDFDCYLSALESAVDFCIRHKYYVDLNLQFGLFLIDVNLRQVFQRKRSSIPASTRSRLEKLFLKNDVVSDYFHSMVQKHQNVPADVQNVKLTRLFYNATTWSKPVDKFSLDLLHQTHINSPKQLMKIYGRWEDYYNSMNTFEDNRPSAAESDACIAKLVWSPSLRLNRRSQPKCLTSPHCKQLLQGGSEFGYGLTHRLLYLVITRYSRRCVVFSEKKDKFMADMICKRCFNEAEFIATNNFQLPDLLYEHIALCGIFGHAQFLRNYWLQTLLNFQVFEGCFSLKIPTGDFDESQFMDDANNTWLIVRTSDIMNGQCNGHFTAVGAGVFSHALRYIIETYY